MTVAKLKRETIYSRVGVVWPAEEKALGTPSSGLPAPEGVLQVGLEDLEALFQPG